jgi:hypothetical protein
LSPCPAEGLSQTHGCRFTVILEEVAVEARGKGRVSVSYLFGYQLGILALLAAKGGVQMAQIVHGRVSNACFILKAPPRVVHVALV